MTNERQNTSLPRLTRAFVESEEVGRAAGVTRPSARHFDLPERVLQFGSGRFLRGFVDAFIHDANEQGAFDGRIVIVQATGRRRAELINQQDGLYTLSIRGKNRDEIIERDQIIASVSRAISAKDDWDEVLSLARSPELTHVISNTTEAGMTFDADDRLDLDPPASFPGKLTAVLYERFTAFDGAPGSGLIILPCELVQDNGDVLRRLVLQTAEAWSLNSGFVEWVEQANTFCNSLVDRIVPGSPSAANDEAIRLGYDDQMHTMAEVYHLWAIEGPPDFERSIPFARASGGIVISEDISPFQERKVRILNGGHTASVPLSLLCGKKTVLDAMEDRDVSEFIRHISFNEILPSLDHGGAEAREFAEDVLDRFRNPFLHHVLKEITLNHISKIRVRVVPSIFGFVERTGRIPPGLALGIAATLFYLRDHDIDDPEAEPLKTWWRKRPEPELLHRLAGILQSESLWGRSLIEIDGLTDLVANYLSEMLKERPRQVLKAFLQREAESAEHDIVKMGPKG